MPNPEPPEELRTTWFTLSARYEISESLGRGGMGDVYRARDTLLNRVVAIKVIKPHGLNSDLPSERFFREAQALARLNHPNIVTLYDYGRTGDLHYLVMELCGRDLSSILKRRGGPLPISEVIHVATGICRAIEYAHDQGVIHRDLKPDNVLIGSPSESQAVASSTEPPAVKVMDFGLAKIRGAPAITGSFTTIGTAQYMSPEQAAGLDADERSDLYSLGVMFYELCAGAPPFLADNFQSLLAKHINLAPVSPTTHNAEIPRAVENLIMRLLQKDKSDRPSSATEVLSALKASTEREVLDERPTRLPASQVPQFPALTPLVGRGQEISVIKRQFESVVAGVGGRLLMVSGEPGIGKTRLVEELAGYARARGAQVLWGRCHDDRGAPPYWPWVQPIRSYVRDKDPDKVISDMGLGAADIAEIVPDLREQVTDLAQQPTVEDPEQARFRLFDSVAAFLQKVSVRSPLVLILEDLQWADESSLLLLEFVAKELQETHILLIGTYRDAELSRRHPLAQALGELTRARYFERVVLRGLTRDDVEEFVSVASRTTPPEGLVGAVYAQTEGNPLFMTEVVRLLIQEEAFTRDSVAGPAARSEQSWSVRLPEGLREMIGRRLNRLSDECNQTLTIASVVGREFALRTLLSLMDNAPETEVLESLEEALQSHVIEELPDAIGRYQFSHAMIQETLVEELSISRRARLHARIAETLEELYGDGAEANAAELAYHYGQAEATLSSQQRARLVHYSLVAGEQALSGHAYEEALSHFRGALAVKHPQAINLPAGRSQAVRAEDEETASILFGLARAQVALDQRGEALVNLGRAFDYYSDVNDVEKAVGIADYPLPMWGVEGISDLLPRALDLVSPDSIQAGRLLSNYGYSLYLATADYEGALQAFELGLVIAKREEDTALELRTLANAANVDGFHMRWREGLGKGLRAIELARNVDEPQAEMRALLWTAVALAATGEPRRAIPHAEAMLALAEKLRDRWWLSLALIANASLCRITGQWQAAGSFSDRSFALAPNSVNFITHRVIMECELGELEHGQAYLQQLVEVISLAAQEREQLGLGMATLVIALAGRITGRTEHFDAAQAVAESVLSWPAAKSGNGILAMACLALIAIQRGDVARAAGYTSALEGQGGTMLASGGPIVAADRVLGLIAQSTSRLDDAASHFEDALAFCRRAGYRPELAWSLCDYTDMLLERNAGGDRQKATTSLDESLTIARELGMKPLVERVMSRRERLGA